MSAWSRTRRAAAAAGAGLVVVTVLTACSAADEANACVRLATALAEGTRAVAEAVSGPEDASEALRAVADDVRAAGADAGDDVEAAAEQLGVVYDGVADSIAAGVAPDSAQLSAAVDAVRQACG